MKGKELKAIRQRLKLTQENFAKMIGVAANSLARWEREERPISQPVARLVRTFRVSKKRKPIR
jgi:DNA-binding transcriptional regulator YiaG